jgi:hypothetical protein
VNPSGVRRGWDPAPIEFRVGSDDGGGLIYSNQVDAELEYTIRPTCAASQGDALFRSALSWRHAFSLAPVLAKDKTVTANCWAMYSAQIATAETKAAGETQQPPGGDPDWITGRN